LPELNRNYLSSKSGTGKGEMQIKRQIVFSRIKEDNEGRICGG